MALGSISVHLLCIQNDNFLYMNFNFWIYLKTFELSWNNYENLMILFDFVRSRFIVAKNVCNADRAAWNLKLSDEISFFWNLNQAFSSEKIHLISKNQIDKNLNYQNLLLNSEVLRRSWWSEDVLRMYILKSSRSSITQRPLIVALKIFWNKDKTLK